MYNKKQLLFYALKYKGNYNLVRQAMLKNERWLECDMKNISYFTILDSCYPQEFFKLKSPPYVLFYRGDISLLKERKCSIVGSRIPCEYATRFTEFAARELAQFYAIVSGMAKGIDGIAHHTAMKKGKTIAILGSGIQRCYPKENQHLYNEIVKSHLLLSEYPFDEEPRKEHFPFRNRLIAALGEFLVVSQAQKRSGTMITVNEALELGKDVYTIPYEIYDRNGEGCNILIEQGAELILSHEDFIGKFIDKHKKIIQYKE